jgi:DNA-binding winged helix-turn-helix (wHTH) protein/Tol biopolymer transport system component
VIGWRRIAPARTKEPAVDVSFGPFEVDLKTHEIKKNGVRIQLTGQAFRVLTILLQNPNQLVLREELKKALWPGDTFVDFEKGVNSAVNRLREALGDAADEPRYIETLPRRGYRFIGQVSRNSASADASFVAPQTQPSEPQVTTGAVKSEKRFGRSIAVLAFCGALVIVSAWLIRRQTPGEATGSPPKTTQISHWNKPMDWVRLSPDGHAVAFASPVNGFQQIFLMLTSGGEPLQLTTDPTDKVLTNFSTDGTEIYYGVDTREAWAVPTLGGKPRRLLSGDVGYNVPEGGSLFYTRNSYSEIFRADKSGTNEELLYKAEDPSLQLAVVAVFPGGKDLIIGYWHVDSNPVGGLAKLNLATRQYVDLGPVLRESQDVEWDEPGTSLLFRRKVNGITNVWKYDLRESRATQLTFGPGPDTWPLRDPEGRGIFFVNWKSSGFLSAYRVQSKQTIDIVSQAANMPVISPDGKRLAYVINLSVREDELWVSDVDGRNKLRLATGEEVGTGSWASDNFHLCFAKGKTTYIMGADGGGLRMLDRPQQNCVWSPDQGSLFVSTQAKQGIVGTWKWNLRVPGGTETKVADGCGAVMAADPSGRYLLSNYFPTSSGGINEISLADGKCTQLLSGVHTWTAVFARDGKSFMYAVNSPDGVTIYRQQWTNGKLVGAPSVALKTPVVFSGFLGDSYDFPEDLSTIVYSRPENRADLYLLNQK